jgi:hypothetical protein
MVHPPFAFNLENTHGWSLLRMIQFVLGAQVARDPLKQHFRRAIDETRHLCG